MFPDLERMFLIYKNKHLQAGGDINDKLFDIKDGAVRLQYTTLCEKLEIPHLHPHDFRHTFISNLISKRGPIPVIEKVSGDTQRTILEKYGAWILGLFLSFVPLCAIPFVRYFNGEIICFLMTFIQEFVLLYW